MEPRLFNRPWLVRTLRLWALAIVTVLTASIIVLNYGCGHNVESRRAVCRTDYECFKYCMDHGGTAISCTPLGV